MCNCRKPTLTLSLDPCPRCGRGHHLPLLFVAQDTPVIKDGIPYTHIAQCTWTLNPILAKINTEGRLELEHA